MIKAKNTIRHFHFNEARFRQVLEREMTALVREAAREWVSAILKSVQGDFPVYTGMAIASLEPIAGELGVAFSYNPKVWHQDKNPSLGRALGQNYSIRVYRNQHGAFRYDFNWSTGVEHWAENEVSRGPPWLNNPGPWKTLETANKAFNRYLEEHILLRFPNVTDYMEMRNSPTGGPTSRVVTR